MLRHRFPARSSFAAVGTVVALLACLGCEPQLQPSSPSTTIEAAGGPGWRVVERTRFLGIQTEPIRESWTYDEQGRLVAVDERVACRCVEERHDTSTFLYAPDTATRLIDRDADGTVDATTVMTFDGGRLRRFEHLVDVGAGDQLTNSGDYQYNDRGEPVVVVFGSGDVTALVRDDDGRIVEVRDNGRLSTSYVYEDEGRLTRIESASTTDVHTFSYDEQGQLVTQRSFRPENFDNTTNFSVVDGRLVSSRSFDTDTPDVAQTEAAYTYDSAGRLLVHDAVDHRSGWSTSHRTTYDDDGRPVSFENFQNGELWGASTTSYDQPADDEVVITVVFDGDEARPVVTRLQHFDEVPVDPFAVPPFSVPFPAQVPQFAQPFQSPGAPPPL